MVYGVVMMGIFDLAEKVALVLAGERPLRKQVVKALEVRPLQRELLPVAPRLPAPPVVIPGYVPQVSRKLSDLILVGRTYHPLCRQAFVEKVQIGYYAYERREEWRTCTLAAAYAGAFGPDSIQRPDFSYTMAVWRLSQCLGYDIRLQVVGPTGRRNSLADEMIKLTDENLWTRAGVAEWVASMGY